MALRRMAGLHSNSGVCPLYSSFIYGFTLPLYLDETPPVNYQQAMRTGSMLLLWLDGGFRVMVVGMMLVSMSSSSFIRSLLYINVMALPR